MRTITIYLFDNALSSTITGPMDIFSSAGIMWNYLMGQDMEPCFAVELASLDGKSVRCFNNLSIKPHKSIHEVSKTDLVLIPAVADDIESALLKNKDVLPWLADLHENKTTLASVCTGTFFLAEAGVLNGKTATTHWAYAEFFKNRYPEITLDTRPLIVRDKNIVCTAGSSSWGELSLFLVQAFCGKQVAVECSKSLLLNMSRSIQAPYGVLTLPVNHKDDEIRAVQDWLQENYGEKISINELANTFHMSPRTFKRRFTRATGSAPLNYIQKLRIEAAKGYLEKSDINVEKIAEKTGYEDISFFRKLFKRHTGLSPKEYKKSFSVPVRGV